MVTCAVSETNWLELFFVLFLQLMKKYFFLFQYTIKYVIISEYFPDGFKHFALPEGEGTEVSKLFFS